MVAQAPFAPVAPSSPAGVQEAPTTSTDRSSPEGGAGPALTHSAPAFDVGGRGRSAIRRHGGEPASKRLHPQGADLSPGGGARLVSFSLHVPGGEYSFVKRGALSFSATTIPPPFDG